MSDQHWSSVISRTKEITEITASAEGPDSPIDSEVPYPLAQAGVPVK